MAEASTTYRHAASDISNAIVAEQYAAAVGVNARQLTLYYNLGCYLSRNTRKGVWGQDAIGQISRHLQALMPGLRGFSATNMKMMRLFYEAWSQSVINSSEASDEFDDVAATNSSVITNELLPMPLRKVPTTPIPAFQGVDFNDFVSVCFSAHMIIVMKVKSPAERAYYVTLCVQEKLSLAALKKVIAADEYHHRGAVAGNFATAIATPEQYRQAMLAFKDEYLLDFINVEQYGVRDIDELDERVVENAIVHNIRNFIMTFGRDFSFIGNQYRVEVMGHEHFIDLLFYNRELACLVAVELKTGSFKPIYLGQLNLYLQALDDFVRKPNENPSIGLILCRNADKPYVEYVARGYDKPMAVATYRTSEDMPEPLRRALPPIEELKKLL